MPLNQLIKISNQSAEILGNYAKCKIRKFHLNNKLLHTRLVPKSISNRYALSDYTETHSNTTKNDLLDFLNILK